MLPQRPLFVKLKTFLFGAVQATLSGMSKPAAIALILFVVAIMAFATWQFFLGRFEAAFSALPFLVICYLFVNRLKQK